MSDFFEIDFLDVESAKSGDAISLRYKIGDTTNIHVVDGGFQETGQKVVDHIRKYYNNPDYIQHVVVTHPDGDHVGGLQTVLEQFNVEHLWMLRPWLYVNEIIDQFPRFSSVENLQKRLKEIYKNIAVLEEIAKSKNIEICEPFQGAIIGEFTVLTPSKKRYIDLIVQSERTPEPTRDAQKTASIRELFEKMIALIKTPWGKEIFSTDETSTENEMSVVQYAKLCNKHLLLTADAGRNGLTEAADFAPYVGLSLPGIDRFQVPHHGSRHNVSTEILDHWLGPRLSSKLQKDKEKFTAIVSSAKKDEDHPRKAVIRALIHRGAKVFTTEGSSHRTSQNAPDRNGWSAATSLEYPEEQEEN